MNVLINSYCNLKCPYCFANPTMKSEGAQNMSIENFKIAIEWCKKLDQHSMRLIGGEPTLAPLFPTFLDMIVQDPWFTEIFIFSNLTFEKQVAYKIALIARKINVTILPNINEFELLSPKHRQTIMWNINFLSQNLNFTLLGINLYRPDMKLDQWEQLLKDFPNFKVVRYSIAIPNEQTLNDPSFDFYSYYHSFQPLLMQMTDWIEKYHIQIICDCNNLPICCFDDEAIRKMLLVNAYQFFGRHSLIETEFGEVVQLQCSIPVIDLRPDLSVATCFGMNPKSVRYIQTFLDVDELMQWLAADADRHEYIARKECLSCPRYKISQISCSCRSCHKILKENIKNV